MSVQLANLSKRFKGVAAVDGVSLTVPTGSFFSVIGASGCGKTTTLRMIAGFETPDSGSIEVDGQDVTALRPHRRPVNTVFQSYALFPHLDVYENVAFGLREARRPRSEIAKRVADMIELVQLSGREKAKPRQLSGGQQQRVALARALINRPKVLLLDEPLGALDLKLRRDMQGQLKRIQHELAVTFVYVTHDQEEAFSMSDAVAVMHRGRIEQVGPPEEVYRRPASAFVADFVGAANRLAGRCRGEIAPGRYLVELEGAGVFACSGEPGTLRDGAGVTVIVRPEDLRIDAAGPEQAGRVLLTVADSSFLGAYRSLRLVSDHGIELTASARGAGAAVRDGDRVSASWPAESAWILSGEASTPELEHVAG
jgi:spermidine/putrescine transport system ATP-binding protein